MYRDPSHLEEWASLLGTDLAEELVEQSREERGRDRFDSGR